MINRFVNLLRAIRNRFGHQTFICWIELVRVRHRSLRLGSTRQPKNRKAAASQPGCVPNRGSGKVWRDLSQQLPVVVAGLEPFWGLTRMSLAGYSLAGWSPPEPASDLPARKAEKSHLDRSACLKKTQASSDHALPVPGQESTVDGQQIGHQFAGHRHRGPVGVSALGRGLGMNLLEPLIEHRGYFCRFD